MGPKEAVEAPLGPTDWYYKNLVPSEPKDFMEFRRRVLEYGYASAANAKELWIMCSRDILFYANSFGWLLNPHDKREWQSERWFGNAREIPFKTREDQNKNFGLMWEALGKRDIIVRKSRDMGASWMTLYLLDHAWRFNSHFHSGLVSKDEDAVDKTGSTSSLMYKLDFIEEHMPLFMRPGYGDPEARYRNYGDHIIVNRENGSTIEGFAAGPDVDRGGRKAAFMFDEMHSWEGKNDEFVNDALQHNCPCRIFISTPSRKRGQGGVFYNICMKEGNSTRVTIPWWDDPSKAAGMYQFDKKAKEVVFFDPEYKYPEGYKFILDGKKRSPYYDWEWTRETATPEAIAAELDMDFGNAGDRIFDLDTLDIIRSTVRDPDVRADIDLRPLTREIPGDAVLVSHPLGSIYLWGKWSVADDGTITPPKGRFAMGADIAFGTGGEQSSYSSLEVFDIESGDQVLEWRDNKTRIEDFGEMAWAIGKLLGDALMTPENNGAQANMFCREFLARGYPNCYMERSGDAAKGTQFAETAKQSFGYRNTDGGLKALMELAAAVRQRKVIIHSEVVFRECDRYIRDGDRAFHPLIRTIGNGRKDTGHGDSAIAMAAMWWGAKDIWRPKKEAEAKPEIPQSGWVRRRLDYIRGQATSRTNYWSPIEVRDEFRQTEEGIIEAYKGRR